MKFFTLFMMLMLSVACTSPTLDTPGNETLIAPGISFEIPPWSPPERPVEAIQMLSGKFKDQTFSFQARISLDNQRLKVTALDPLGRRAFDILWNEKGVTSNKASWVPNGISSTNILADIIITFWPKNFIESGLNGDRSNVYDNPGLRTINDSSGKVITVSYSTDRHQAWNQTTKLSNVSLGYELTIQSSEIKP